MIKLIDILREAKQVGTLYHVMDTDKFMSFLHTDKLRKPTSFSRNKDYDNIVGREKDYVYQIVVDGDRLSNNYKIRPINQGQDWVADEYEEIVERDITEAGKYVTAIIVIVKKRFGWKEKGYDKSTYNPWQGISVELSSDLYSYMQQYPNVKLMIKDGHGGRIHPTTDKDMKWLRSVGIVNPKEKEISETVEGVYRNKKPLTRQVKQRELEKFIRANQDLFYTKSESGQVIPISKIDQSQPYWDSEFVNDPDDFLTTDENRCVVLRQQRDQDNRIYVQILYGDSTAKDVPYYKELVAKTGKEADAINVRDSYRDMGQVAE